MKIADTKIYLKFIAWFLLVAILPLILLFAILFQFDLSQAETALIGAETSNILFGLFITLALVLILALVAARILSQSITSPVQFSVEDLLRVVKNLDKSINNLSLASQDSRQVVKFLSNSTRQQQKGLDSGHQSIGKIAKSLDQIVNKVNITTQNTASIDKLTDESEAKVQAGLGSLLAVKQLSTENQKLTQALDDYTERVSIIAQRVESMADLAKYLSLNATIEANKTNISEEFSGIVNQIRQLNTISQQAAVGIKDLTGNMQRQIEQTKKASIYGLQETEKSISVIGQSIKFLANITKRSREISTNIKIINKETVDTRQSANEVMVMLANLNKESKTIVKSSQEISVVVNKQILISQSLSRSFSTLQRVANSLGKLVEKIS